MPVGLTCQIVFSVIQPSGKVSKTYGEIISFISSEDNFSSKHGWEFSLGKAFENGLMLRDFDDHKFHRGLLQDSFRRDALVNYLHIIQPILDEWIENLKSKKSFNLFVNLIEVWKLILLLKYLKL